jgi:hypothetical protein
MKTMPLICLTVLWLAILCPSTRAQMQMISDAHFQTGFVVLSPSGGVEGNLQYTAANGPPQWMMGQWDSRQSIYGTAGQNQADGSVKWSNDYKTVMQSPTAGANADLVLGLNSIQEYGNSYRSATAPWPALLVQQSISEPGGWRAATAPSVAQMNHAFLSLGVRLTRANNVYTTGYDSSLHAAQFPIYFTIQNLNPASSGYGKYFWYGILIYDDRYPVTSAYSLLDLGTQSLIYANGLDDFGFSAGPQPGQWLTLNVDMLPHIKNGLKHAWSHGYLTESQTIGDYKIGAMNIGWEVPGLGDVEMQIRNLGLEVSVPGSLPQIEVEGLGGYCITNGDTTPSATDGTLLPTVLTPGGFSSRILSVRNANASGSVLNLTGSPSVQVSGPGAGRFLVHALPGTSIAGGSSTNFEIRYAPNAVGTHKATLTIASNDPSVPAYAFDIQGSAQWPVDSDADTLPDGWEAQFWTLGGGNPAHGPAGDPDGDGVSNLLEYALDSNPVTPGMTQIPLARTAVNPADGKPYMTFTYRRRTGASGLVYTVQVSETLGSWISGPTETEEIGSTANPGGDSETVLVRIKPALNTPGKPRKFARLQVVTP